MDNKILQFFINIPVALFGGLFMPLPWQGSNWLVHIVGVINLMLLVFFLFRSTRNFNRKLDKGVWCYAWFFYVTGMAVLMAYSTPNFGTLERYKISYLSFFIIWLLNDNPLLFRIKTLLSGFTIVR